MASIDSILADLLKNEGGWVNNPDDPGGETNWGITVGTARANGYTGLMKDLSRNQALEIYRGEYWTKPGFGRVFEVSPGIAAELFDTAVNCGVGVPCTWLQACLNALNRQQKDYADLAEDGDIGPATLAALKAYLGRRDDPVEAEHVMLKALNCLQGARYLSLAKTNKNLESFVYGWLSNRVDMSI